MPRGPPLVYLFELPWAPSTRPLFQQNTTLHRPPPAATVLYCRAFLAKVGRMNEALWISEL